MSWNADEEYIKQLEKTLAAVDDILICNCIPTPIEYDPVEYRYNLNWLLNCTQNQAIYLEQKRLIKLNEDFYGPAHRDETIPFLP